MSLRLPRFVTVDEYEKLTSRLDELRPCQWVEYKIALILGFYAGLRLSEVVGFEDRVPSLTSAQIDFQAHTITVLSGKGGKDRVVPLPKAFLRKYADLLPLKLSRRSIQWFVKRWSQEILGKDLSFHSFRHGFGTKVSESRPIHEVQMLMGHSRLDTTGIYLHANPKRAIEGAREAFEK